MQTFLTCNRTANGNGGKQGPVISLPAQKLDYLLRERSTVRTVAGAKTVVRQLQSEGTRQVIGASQARDLVTWCPGLMQPL